MGDDILTLIFFKRQFSPLSPEQSQQTRDYSLVSLQGRKKNELVKTFFVKSHFQESGAHQKEEP